MKLIGCNVFRCLWFLVYSIIALHQIDVATMPIYCQVSGFFLALGTEAVGQ
jgi:hypothetical protein